MEAEALNFFALLNDGVARLPVTQALQTTLDSEFQRQRNDFFQGDPDEVPFDPGHEADQSCLTFIGDFSLPAAMQSAMGSSLDQDIMKMSARMLGEVRGVFAVGVWDGETEALIQVFDRRRYLDAAGISLIFSRGTFKSLAEPGLTLDHKLAAVFRSNRLFFKSFYVARRLFDLSKYFREATDEDLESFSEEPKVSLETPETLTSNADEWVRKRIALLKDSKVMKEVSPRKISIKGKEFGLDIKLTRKGHKEALVFPADKRALKELLRFLEQNYYASPLTGDKFISNSKRPLNR